LCAAALPDQIFSSLHAVQHALAPAYRVERLVGSGGAATVYLAHDAKHDRRVAIKLLRGELAGTDGAIRFVREIHVAARLTHPNIVPLLDSGSVGSTPFYVMPFVEGESLRGRLEREGRIPLDEAIALTAEIADALDYAHAAGIVHRDIKPENILLLSGHAIVADFGIARAVKRAIDDTSATSQGFILGTPAYMSPEQASGTDDIDARSDVYALATMLYEMLCGTIPFNAPTIRQLIAQRFSTAAPRLASCCPDVPSYIDAAVAAGLAFEPDDRPATAGALARMLTGGGATSTRGPIPRTTVAARGTATQRAAAISDGDMPSVAVLPFANLTADPLDDFLSDGITEEIMTTLSRMRTIRVAARSSSFAFKGRHEDVRVIAEQLGVTSVLDGSVRRSGTRVRVAAQLVDARTGFQLWSDRIDRAFDDAFAIQDDIARAIVDALSATLLETSTTASHDQVAGPVYELYLRGRFALNKRTEAELLAATEYFEQAVAQNAEYALAFAGLADALLMLGVYGARPADSVMPRARGAAEQALAIHPALGEAHATLGSVRALFDWDWRGAEDSFQRARALSPRYSTAWQWYALNLLIPRGRLDEARTAIDRARSLDPLSMVMATSVGAVYHLSGDAAGAVRALRRASEIDPHFVMTHYFLGGALRDVGDLAASETELRQAIASSGGTPEMVASLAQTLARAGRQDEARELLAQLTTTAARRHVSPCLLAQAHAALGELPDALDALERAAGMHDPELVFIGARPSYAPLKREPRFMELRSRVGV
jgi:serine/threonine protein kinase/tetratricopeptide (TPR) repeat protein